MSNDEVGLVLLGVALVFALLGYILSRAGLAQVSAAAEQAKEAAKNVNQLTANAQPVLAMATGDQASTLAATTAQATEGANALSDSLTQVKDALAAMTGPLAPARVAWSLCAFCLAAALVSFDLISVAVTPEATT